MNDINTLKAEIAAAQAIINAAKPLADKLAEMQAAAATVAQTAQRLAVLADKLAAAETAERIKAQAVAGWTIQSIRPVIGDASASGRHIVTAHRRVHGLDGQEVVTEQHTLSNLGTDLLAAVVANPEQVPAYILALDPDTEQALRLHARHVRRGYMAS